MSVCCNVVWLRCENESSSIESLASAADIPASLLLDAIGGYDEEDAEQRTDIGPDRRMPRQILSLFEMTAERVASGLAGAYYYHGTRTSEPESFRERGILALSEAIDEVWDQLRVLTFPFPSGDDWTRCRKRIEGWDNYKLKVENPEIGGGPFARLVRAVHIEPTPPERDYLRNAPEIVEDITTALQEECSISTHERYMEVTQPCLVIFRSSVVTATEVESALWYLYDHSRNRPPGRWAAQGGFSGGGTPIPPSDIVDVETFDW